MADWEPSACYFNSIICPLGELAALAKFLRIFSPPRSVSGNSSLGLLRSLFLFLALSLLGEGAI